MSTTKPASEWTQDEINSYLSELNNTHLQERLLVFIFIYSTCLAGVLGNTLTFVVYFKHFPDKSTRMFVLGLTATDLTNNLIGSPFGHLINAYFYIFYSEAACKAFYTIPRVLFTLSVSLLGLIAFDRYRHVCKPHHKQISPRTALLLILVASSVSFGTSLLLIPIYNIVSVPTNVLGINGSHCIISYHTINPNYTTFYLLLNSIIFVSALFMMIVCYGNIGILILCRLGLSRPRPGASSSKRLRPFCSPPLSMSLKNFPQTIVYESYSSITTFIDESKVVEVGNNSEDSSYDTRNVDFKNLSGISPPQKSFNYLKTGSDKDDEEPDSSGESSLNIFEIPNMLLQRVKSHLQTSDIDKEVEHELPPSQVSILDAEAGKKLPPLQTSVMARENERELSPLHSSVLDTFDKNELSPLQTKILDTNDKQESARKTNNMQGIYSKSSLNQSALQATTDVADESTNKPSKTKSRVSNESSDSADDVDKEGSSFYKKVCPTASCKLCPCCRRRSRHTATTMMMFVLTLLFVVLFLPFIIVSSITPPHKIPCQGLPIVELNFCEMAIYYFPVLNSVVNPFVYSMFSYRFRQECKRYLCWFRKS